MYVNLELYRIFIAVSKNGSFTEASHELNLTQSAVSQAVKQLESALNARLFVRTPKGTVMTAEGKLLFDYIRKALDSVSTAERFFEQFACLEKGSLKIGASDTLCRHYLMPFLKDFHEKHPKIDISVTNRTSGETADLLRQGRVDVGFVNLPMALHGDLETVPLKTIRDCFVCGERYRENFTEAVELSDLTDYPLIMLESLSASRKYTDSYFKSVNISLEPQIELGSLDLLSEFARNNLGIALCIREFINTGHDGLHVIELKKEIPSRSIGMLTRRGEPLSLACRTFVEMLG